MTILIATLGLPASGKSTWARFAVTEVPDLVRVNKDDLRRMLYGGGWNAAREVQVGIAHDALLYVLLQEGTSVVCDNTNFGRIQYLRSVAEHYGALFTVQDFTDVGPEECIARDALRGDASVGPEVIWRMYREHIEPTKGDSRVEESP